MPRTKRAQAPAAAPAPPARPERVELGKCPPAVTYRVSSDVGDAEGGPRAYYDHEEAAAAAFASAMKHPGVRVKVVLIVPREGDFTTPTVVFEAVLLRVEAGARARIRDRYHEELPL